MVHYLIVNVKQNIFIIFSFGYILLKISAACGNDLLFSAANHFLKSFSNSFLVLILESISFNDINKSASICLILFKLTY